MNLGQSNRTKIIELNILLYWMPKNQVETGYAVIWCALKLYSEVGVRRKRNSQLFDYTVFLVSSIQNQQFDLYVRTQAKLISFPNVKQLFFCF